MTEIIKKIEQISGLCMIPLEADEYKECIIYTPNPIKDNGISYTYQLNLNIICKTLSKVEDITKRISTIVNIGDTEKMTNTDIEINGGGTLTNGEYVHRFLYLQITEKR